MTQPCRPLLTLRQYQVMSLDTQQSNLPKKYKKTSVSFDSNVENNLSKLRVEQMSQWEKQVFFCENEKWSLLKIAHKQNYYTRTLSDDEGLYTYKVWRFRIEKG
jgi:hypothetical protein